MKHLQKRPKNAVKPRSGRREWAAQINAAWRKSVAAIFETGHLLIAAKASLEHGAWQTMVGNDLKFNPRVAQMLMAIEHDRRLVKPKIFTLLPPAYTTIYQISQLTDDQLKARAADGTIRSDMTGREIVTINKQTSRAAREKTLGTKQSELPQKKFGVIAADPEWDFEPWSRETGTDRAASNHYPTSCLAVIQSRDIASIAADDCVLFLCATPPMLPHALVVMAAWGFDYKTNYTFEKDRVITGYWARFRHEHLLIGARGAVPCPAPGTQWDSLIPAPVGKHSAKGDRWLEMIEQYFPTMPKIELNRRGKARSGWTAWGNEAE